ncbi:MAG: hypothetical protein HC933_03510, partial [Pleurocapsa sp. SU_196_0]|nr:hypothetical protein [Pleurocapsa sp. SU_196_0]
MTPRTLRNWLSSEYSGSRWLSCWISRRTWYATRSDGFRCRGGTLWRVSLETKACSDRTAAPKPSYEALRTPWRSYQELPGFARLEDSVADDKGISTDPEKNVPKEAGRLEIRVEGRHQTLFLGFDPRCFLNSGNTLPSAARARNSSTWLKAEAVAKRLNDRSSTAFWFKQFRSLESANLSDGAVWSAVGQAFSPPAHPKPRASRLTEPWVCPPKGGTVLNPNTAKPTRPRSGVAMVKPFAAPVLVLLAAVTTGFASIDADTPRPTPSAQHTDPRHHPRRPERSRLRRSRPGPLRHRQGRPPRLRRVLPRARRLRTHPALHHLARRAEQHAPSSGAAGVLAP